MNKQQKNSIFFLLCVSLSVFSYRLHRLGLAITFSIIALFFTNRLLFGYRSMGGTVRGIFDKGNGENTM